MVDTPKLIGIAGAVKRYSVGRSSIYDAVARGHFRAVKFGARTLIDVAAADEFFASLPQADITCARKKPAA
jgi:hypothetical protein